MTVDVLVIGAGNQGLALAGHLANEGLSVGLWNRTQCNIQKLIQIPTVHLHGVFETKVSLSIATSNIDQVDSKLIYITVPTDAHDDIARILTPKISNDTVIILSPGRTFGALNFQQQLLQNGCIYKPRIFETQTIIHTARLLTSNSVHIYALKNNVLISSLHNEIDWFDYMPKCLKRFYKPVDSYIYTSLGNVGLVLHCIPTLLNIGCVESPNVSFKYYIDGISPTIARMIEAIDRERISVGKALGYSLLSTKEWMQEAYGIKGSTLYECIQNNDNYKELLAPNTKNHRYILEDVPNGLVPLEYLAKSLGISCRMTTLSVDIANAIMEKDFREIGRKFTIRDLKVYE